MARILVLPMPWASTCSFAVVESSDLLPQWKTFAWFRFAKRGGKGKRKDAQISESIELSQRFSEIAGGLAIPVQFVYITDSGEWMFAWIAATMILAEGREKWENKRCFALRLFPEFWDGRGATWLPIRGEDRQLLWYRVRRIYLTRKWDALPLDVTLNLFLRERGKPESKCATVKNVHFSGLCVSAPAWVIF